MTDDETKRQVAAIIARDIKVPALEDEIAQLREALSRSDAAIREYYRYWTGGEARGSYDGKPVRQGLWDAMHKNRAALAQETQPKQNNG